MKSKSKQTKSFQTKSKSKPKKVPPPTPPRYLCLQPSMIGPWITGTNKTSLTAFNNHVCRVAGALMGGWEEPSTYQNESIRRARALRSEALASLDTYADMVMLPGNEFSVLDPISILGVTIQACPHGFSFDRHIGCTVYTPCAANQLNNVDAGFTTEELWDGLAHLAMIPVATHWLAVSYSPPFAPIVKWLDRRDYPLVIQEIRDAFGTFNAAVDSMIKREMKRLAERKVSYFQIHPLQLPTQ